MFKKAISKLGVIAVILCNSFYSTAQPYFSNKSDLQAPLDGTLRLSANYGELRSGHFHSGLDFKVGGTVGARLYAVADGYISRINVSPGGYGRAVYITHTNGLTSVYGHLNGFASPIKETVEAAQYEHQRFPIDTTFAPNRFPVKKGTLIGYAGNSGNSFGPHLHFEFRDENQVPLNPANFYTFVDKEKPELNRLMIFSIDSVRSVPVSRATHNIDLKIAKGNVKIDSVIHVDNTIYFALESTNRMTDSYNRFGIRTMKVMLDSTVAYSININNISFNLSRYINSLVAYDERERSGKWFIKTYVEPGNMLGIFNQLTNNGMVTLNDENIHKVSIAVADDYGNTSTLNFRIQKKKNASSKTIADNKETKVVYWDKGCYHANDDIVIHIPECALYNSILFSAARLDSTLTKYSSTFRIHTPETPLHRPIEISIKADVPESLRDKAFIAYYSSNPKKSRSMGGKWENGFVNASAWQFGYFYVAIDAVAPTLTPNFKRGANIKTWKEINVKAKDELSGINSYNGYIDGKWVLFEYDAKNDMLTFELDKRIIKQGQKHELRLEVDDEKGNRATLRTNFTW